MREALYPVVGEKTLRELVKEAKANDQVFAARVRTVLRSSYSNHYRRMLPALLAALDFRSNNSAYRPVMVATELLARYASIDGNRWRNPEDDLPGDFDTAREVHYAAIRQPLDPTEFIAGLKQRMSQALNRLETGLAQNTTGGVRLTRRRGEQWISVPKLEKQPEPENLEKIKS